MVSLSQSVPWAPGPYLGIPVTTSKPAQETSITFVG